MLDITKRAAEAIREIVLGAEHPETAGIRIFARDVNGEKALQLSAVDAPEETDEVVELRGVKIFVAPEAAPQLEGKLLDAGITREGPVFTFGEKTAEDHMWTGSRYAKAGKMDPRTRAAEMQAKLGATKLKMNADAVAALIAWLESPEAASYDSELERGMDALCTLWSRPRTRGVHTAFGKRISGEPSSREW